MNKKLNIINLFSYDVPLFKKPKRNINKNTPKFLVFSHASALDLPQPRLLPILRAVSIPKYHLKSLKINSLTIKHMKHATIFPSLPEPVRINSNRKMPSVKKIQSTMQSIIKKFERRHNSVVCEDKDALSRRISYFFRKEEISRHHKALSDVKSINELKVTASKVQEQVCTKSTIIENIDVSPWDKKLCTSSSFSENVI